MSFEKTQKIKIDNTMTFPEIILNIDQLILKEEFIQIQILMNEIFMNSSFIKETQQKKEITEKIDNILFSINDLNSENINIKLIYISLNFVTLLESKI